jgi:hypothetical protein
MKGLTLADDPRDPPMAVPIHKNLVFSIFNTTCRSPVSETDIQCTDGGLFAPRNDFDEEHISVDQRYRL